MKVFRENYNIHNKLRRSSLRPVQKTHLGFLYNVRDASSVHCYAKKILDLYHEF